MTSTTNGWQWGKKADGKFWELQGLRLQAPGELCPGPDTVGLLVWRQEKVWMFTAVGTEGRGHKAECLDGDSRSPQGKQQEGSGEQ